MSVHSLREAAAASAARQKARTAPETEAPDPRWKTKKSPRGTLYRVITISLDEFPRFMEKNKFSPKMYFSFPGEGDVLEVRKDGEEGDREL